MEMRFYEAIALFRSFRDAEKRFPRQAPRCASDALLRE